MSRASNIRMSMFRSRIAGPGACCALYGARCRDLRLAAARLFCTLLGGILFAGCNSPPPVELRGFAHHRETKLLGSQADLDVQLVGTPDGVPSLQFTRLSTVNKQETVYHEKVMEYPSGGDTDSSKIRKVTVPGEYIAVLSDPTSQVEREGPLANAEVRVNGTPVVLNAQGAFVDRQGLILALFDQKDMGEKTDVTVDIQYAPVGAKRLTVTRRQFLDVLGIPWDCEGAAANDGLAASVTLTPEQPKPGDGVTIRLTVTNRGRKPAAKVVGRTFSRQPWLNGCNFYIGTVPPKASRSFSRLLRVPAASHETAFGVLSLWDLNVGEGPAQDQRLEVPLQVGQP